jgi:mycothiol synthase
MTTRSGYAIRAPERADLDAVADVFVADEIHEAGQVVLGADFVRDEWERPRFDLSSDAWVAVDREGTVVGYAQVTRDEAGVLESWGVVHPEHRARGVGSALLDRIERRVSDLAAASPSVRFRHAVNAGDLDAAAMLRARGLRPVRHFWHMQIDLGGSPDPGAAPTGIQIASVGSRADLEAVHAVLDQAFAGDWGYHPEPFDRWLEEQANSPSHDPSLWLVARADGNAVGALTANVWDDGGWVGELGVVPSHRGRGVAIALLRRSFATFERLGCRRVTLNVDAENPTGATALYERVGMRVVRRWDLWERSAASVG